MKTKGHEIGRREFLLVSSTCALAAAAVGPKLFGAERSAIPDRLAVGFAALDAASAVRDAASVSSADGGFISRGARISASGASGPATQPIERRLVELKAHYAYFDGAELRDAPFVAWGCNRVSGCQGSPTSFTVPVDYTQKLVFSVETERGKVAQANPSRRDAFTTAPTENVSLPVTLALGGEGLKLSRGFYVIVPLYENDGEPRWSAYELKNLDGRWALHDGAGNVATFEHFVLRIDYAS